MILSKEMWLQPQYKLNTRRGMEFERHRRCGFIQINIGAAGRSEHLGNRLRDYSLVCRMDAAERGSLKKI